MKSCGEFHPNEQTLPQDLALKVHIDSFGQLKYVCGLCFIIPKKVKFIPVFKREDIPKAFSFADAIIGQMRSGLGGAVEREGAFCKKPVLQYANPEIKFLVDSNEISSPFLPQSNDPIVLAKLIDKIVLSKEFRDELILDEYNFVK